MPTATTGVTRAVMAALVVMKAIVTTATVTAVETFVLAILTAEMTSVNVVIAFQLFLTSVAAIEHIR